MDVWTRHQARQTLNTQAAPSHPFGPGGLCEVPTGGRARALENEEPDKTPFVLLAPTPRGDVIHGTNEQARQIGLAPGQKATDAMAGVSDLRVAYADPAAEAAALERLAGWMRRWSPHIRPDGVDGVALDVTGCTHLFGGSASMLADMEHRLSRLGVTARLAMAPNHAAAHALARYGSGGGDDTASITEEAHIVDVLAPLPVAALRIDPGSIMVLERLGLKTIGHLAVIPRAALKKRFGARIKRRDPRDDTYDDYLGRTTDRSSDVLARLDEALGRVIVPLDPTREIVPPRMACGLVEPITSAESVLLCTQPLLEDLGDLLESRGLGVRSLLLEAFRVDGGRSQTVLRLSHATRDAPHLISLLKERLDGWHAEFGYDALAVEAVETQKLTPVQGSTNGLADPSHTKPDRHALIDRLSARLGRDAVLVPHAHASHWPDRSETWGQDEERAEKRTPSPLSPGATTTETALGRVGGSTLMNRPGSIRPDRLFDPPHPVNVIHAVPDGPPVRFTWRHNAYDVARYAGPERIAPEWWRERSTARARDYWRVETGDGERLWLFREGHEGDERDGLPRWFLHGLFA